MFFSRRRIGLSVVKSFSTDSVEFIPEPGLRTCDRRGPGHSGRSSENLEKTVMTGF
jgi:hypothetical protein